MMAIDAIQWGRAAHALPPGRPPDLPGRRLRVVLAGSGDPSMCGRYFSEVLLAGDLVFALQANKSPLHVLNDGCRLSAEIQYSLRHCGGVGTVAWGAKFPHAFDIDQEIKC